MSDAHSEANTQVDVADAISQLTTGYVYQRLQQFDREFNWYKIVFYGDLIEPPSVMSKLNPLVKEDLESTTSQLNYLAWAAVNNPQKFMTYITEAGSEVPILVGDVCSELMNTMNYLAEINFKPKMKGDEAYFKRFGMYYAALRYFGKLQFLKPYLNNADYEGAFGDCVSICYEPIEEFKGLIETFYGITEADFKARRGGLILPTASFAPDDWLKRYEQARTEYFDSVAMVLDILRNQPNLQLCLNSIKIGDVYGQNINDSTINNTYQINQYVKCINSAMESEKESETTSPEPPKEEPEKPKNEPDDDKDDEDKEKGMSKAMKITLIVGSVVGVLLLVIFILVIVFKNKKSKPNAIALNQPLYNPISQ